MASGEYDKPKKLLYVGGLYVPCNSNVFVSNPNDRDAYGQVLNH